MRRRELMLLLAGAMPVIGVLNSTSPPLSAPLLARADEVIE
jgi:hypothetical protein